MTGKVCLVIPPSIFLLDERVFMTLGVLRVAAVLEQAGVFVEVLDLSGVENYLEAFRAHVRLSAGTNYGFTATTPQMPQAADLVEVLREEKPEAKAILGGPHVTLVNAAVKRKSTRAVTALKLLQEKFDVLVFGDGERSIFQALTDNPPPTVDGDDPQGSLFLNNSQLNDLPFPARHLVDASSYHYQIDGVNALSIIAQLGCLTGDTCITMGNGLQLPIRDVKKGDVVLSYDVDEKVYRKMPVKETWKREADDLYECAFDDGTILKVTGEHPIWTTYGWKTVEELRPMRDEVYFNDPSAGEVLFKEMPRKLAEDSYSSEMVESGTRRDASQMGGHDSNGKSRKVEYQDIACQRKDSKGSEDFLGNKDGREKSDEAARSGGEGIGNHQEALGELLRGSTPKFLEKRKNEDTLGKRRNASVPEQGRTGIGQYPDNDSANIQVCGERSFLERTVPFWEKTKSRLLRYRSQEGDSSSRGILALQEIQSNRSSGLSKCRVNPTSYLVQGIEPKESNKIDTQTKVVWRKLVSKKFVGKSTVYNLTVHPVHTYFANNLLVHNCPFGCGFCGGRFSPMLRRIRTRTTDNIIEEMRHMHLTYGTKGFMFYDDELNVNPQMIELMNAIAQLQEELGVDFKLRGFIKSQLFTNDQASAMYRAGFRWILTGFESGSPKILENINKKATRDENTRCVEIAKKNNLKVKALMSIGHPGESPETIRETEEWLLQNKPDDFDATIITTYPGTPYYDEAVKTDKGDWCYTAKSGDKLYGIEVDYMKVADYYKGDPDGGYKSYVYTDSLSPEQLVSARDGMERFIRGKLEIPFNRGVAAQRFEHSMGQTGLPSSILRSTSITQARAIA